jgi:hypothetical protein
MHHKLYALEPIKVYQICIAWMRVWYGRLQEEMHAKSKGFWFSCWDWRDMLSRAGSGCDVNDPNDLYSILQVPPPSPKQPNNELPQLGLWLELDGAFRLGLVVEWPLSHDVLFLISIMDAVSVLWVDCCLIWKEDCCRVNVTSLRVLNQRVKRRMTERRSFLKWRYWNDGCGGGGGWV